MDGIAGSLWPTVLLCYSSMSGTTLSMAREEGDNDSDDGGGIFTEEGKGSKNTVFEVEDVLLH